MSPRKRKKPKDGEESEVNSPASNGSEDPVPDLGIDTRTNDFSSSTPKLSEKKEPGKEKKKSRGCFSFKCLAMALIMAVVLVVTVLYLGPFFINGYLIYQGYERATNFGIPPSLMNVFDQYDGDGNGALDPYEFMFAAEELTSSSRKPQYASQSFEDFNETYEPTTFIDHHRGEELEFVEVEVDFEPLILSTMTKFKDSDNVFGKPPELVPGLFNWQTPRVPIAEYGTKNFQQFAPPSHLGVGEPYFITGKYSSDRMSEMLSPGMNPRQYFPPAPKAEEILLHVLMMQLHKHPFVTLRFGPRGTRGILRAENEHFWDISIRAHVEFQLNTYPDLPFWFTPAQFSGRLIMSKDSSHVVKFELEVPNNRSLNIDMEWLTAKEGDNEVDIGYLPKMRLSSVGPSRREGAPPQPPEEEPKWTTEIDAQTAKDKLEQSMYPFTDVKYHDFKDAFDLAAEQNKPVHHILLWGALDDQSC